MLICASCCCSFLGTDRQIVFSEGGRRVYCSLRCKSKVKRAKYNAANRERLRAEGRARAVTARQKREVSLPLISCHYCGSDVLPKLDPVTGKVRVYCSDEHRAEHRRGPGTVFPTVCLNPDCSVAFVAKTAHARYCSNRCKMRVKVSTRDNDRYNENRRAQAALRSAALTAIEHVGLLTAEPRLPYHSPYTGTCRHCGTSVIAIERASYFCSPECRSLHTKQRSKRRHERQLRRRRQERVALMVLQSHGLINLEEETMKC